jgi:hypothetical protein
VKEEISQTPIAGTEEPAASFRGFKQPTSSTTYTPNQLFDVVLPHASRGCLRLVAYLMRKTLGWSDEHGNPQNPTAHVSYRELIEKAGISRGAIKEALDEALAKKFIECLRFGQPHKAGEEGYSALYSLRWDDRGNYITSIDEFNGFFAGDGNLTHIPNQFFDHLIPREPLAVVRVVGVIIRHTIGFQTKFGFRRQQIAMSFTEIMRRTGIASSSTVSSALKTAIDRLYISKVTEGFFDPNAGLASQATTFGIYWEDSDQFEPNSAKGSKIEAEEQFKNRSGNGETVQKSKRNKGSKIEAVKRSEIEAGSVQKSKREEFKNRSDIKTTLLNNTLKQQQTAVAVDHSSNVKSNLIKLLMTEGIDHVKAVSLVDEFPSDQIKAQLDALPLRFIRSSRTGFLIKAIEINIPLPQSSVQECSFVRVASHFYAELGGNDGDPVAYLDTSDNEASKALLSRVPMELMPEDKLGRHFAAFAKSRAAARKREIHSLAQAVKSFGDEYVKSLSHRRSTEKKEQESRDRFQHEKEFEGTYQSHIKQIAADLAASDSDLYQSFEQWISVRIEKRKAISESLYRRSKEQLEDSDGRASFIVDFLTEVRPGMLPGFWEWDSKFNPQSFSKEGAKA